MQQTEKPDEIIIVDGGSSDKTLTLIENLKTTYYPKQDNVKDPSEANHSLSIKIITKTGNRSVGRNEAIKQSKNEIILSLDAGCIADKNWIKNITEPFKNSDTDVVAGYYKGNAKNIFQKCLIPYVLIMPDKINPDNFLPSGRSMAFKKIIWEKIKGFNENYSHNEDYVFAKDLKKINAKIVFKKDAIINWIPRENLAQSFYMFFRFAYGDAEAKILRPKVIFLFARYTFILLLMIFYIINKSDIILYSLILIFTIYMVWAITKNYRYVNHI
jgi:glycosyltransferase involved in cell wall biosynthesis